MKRNKFFIVGFVFAGFFLACNSKSTNTNTINESETIKDTIVLVNTVEEIDTEPDSLDIYFSNPLDFYNVKQETRAMHSGGIVRLPSKYFHEIADSNSIYYDYWAIEFLGMVENEQRPLCFKVIKPWSTPEERYYEADNETLIGIQSCIEWEGLAQSNFVNLSDSTIIKSFGQPDTIVLDCFIYSCGEKLLSLKITNNKVEWFKFLWLNYSFEENSEVLSGFVNW